MPLLTVNVDNPDELIALYGAGSLLRWEYSADNSSFTEGGVEALVSGTTQYVIEHQTASTFYYRTRYSTSAPATAAQFSDYSDSWLVGSLEAYCTRDDVTEMLALGTATGHLNLITDLCADVSADIDALTGRRFFRDPQVTGTATVYADVLNGGCSSLEDAIGRPRFVDGRALDIVSITNLYVRESETSSYVEVTAGDTGYYLDGWSSGVGVFGTDWPYEDVLLSRAGTYAHWPIGRRAVKIVGVLGFPKVPAVVKRAAASEVRERFRQGVGGGAQPAGVNQFGTPVFLTGNSAEMRRIMARPFSRKPLAA